VRLAKSGPRRTLRASPTAAPMRRLLLALALLVAAAPSAQTTFTVSFNAGEFAYDVDGVPRATLTLERGQTYTFQMDNTPSIHPFYISTSSTGGGAGVWTDGVTGNFATGTAALTFTVPSSAPDELFYQCGVHTTMGGSLTIVGTSSTETPPDGTALALAMRSSNPSGTASRVALVLREAGDARVTLHDATGRRVATLLERAAAAGATEIGVPTAGLAAGVYVVRAEAAGEAATLALTVVR